MRWKSLEPYRPFIFLGIFILVWWLTHGLVRRVSRDLLYEVQAPAWVGASYVADMHATTGARSHSKRELVEEVRDLRRLNGAFRLQADRADGLQAELLRLETFLDLPARPGFRSEIARVVRRDVNQWWQRIVVRKGAVHGLVEGAPVIFNEGIVGRVVDVHAYTAEVVLVTSPRFRIAAHFDGDPRPVTYEGRGGVSFSPPQGSVANVPSDLLVVPGERRRLVSSGLGRVFPPGLTIGYVSDLDPGSDGIFLEGRVQLAEALLTVQEVAILLPEASEAEEGDL